MQFLASNNSNNKIIHIKGREFIDSNNEMLCENPTLLNVFKNNDTIMPSIACTSECYFGGKCRYTKQFADDSYNWRIMTHKELTNPESAYFNGVETSDDSGKWYPKSKKWIPDYIIVDESCLDTKKYKEERNSPYLVIGDIIGDVLRGNSLAEAITGRENEIIKEYCKMTEIHNKKISFTSSAQYIREAKQKRAAPWSQILVLLFEYVYNGKNPDDLKKIRFKEFEKVLSHTNIVPIAERYQNTPTLYLDATSNANVVNRVVGNINYVSLPIKMKEDINIYQLENFLCSKSKLKSQDQMDDVIDLAKGIVPKYSNVGVIFYKWTGLFKNNPEELAKRIGASVFGHFGNLRGINSFDDCDCILVIGRHAIPVTEIEDYVLALYPDEDISLESSYKEVPIRMKDGRVMTLKNRIYDDPRVNDVVMHMIASETQQAVGRGRLIFGNPKDIYLFSSESLGTGYEVTDFFRLQESQYKNALNEAKKRGKVRNKKMDLLSLGFTEYAYEKCREEIDKEFIAAGFTKENILSKDKAYRKIEWEYYVWQG